MYRGNNMKQNMIIAILIMSLIGAMVFPLIGVYFPQIRQTLDWFGYTVIMSLAIAMQSNSSH